MKPFLSIISTLLQLRWIAEFSTQLITYVMESLLMIFFAEAQVIAVTSPSFVNKVKYTKLVKDLYKTSITNEADEDTCFKTLIANVDFGCLERGQNKVQKSKICNTLEEARHHQATYGGRVSILKKFHSEVIAEICELDSGEDAEATTKTDWIEYTNKYYILNVSDCATLQIGFRYIKELLLQHHNFKNVRRL
jgi:hypothetical protein